MLAIFGRVVAVAMGITNAGSIRSGDLMIIGLTLPAGGVSQPIPCLIRVISVILDVEGAGDLGPV